MEGIFDPGLTRAHRVAQFYPSPHRMDDQHFPNSQAMKELAMAFIASRYLRIGLLEGEPIETIGGQGYEIGEFSYTGELGTA